jgi:hypothetical protein
MSDGAEWKSSGGVTTTLKGGEFSYSAAMPAILPRAKLRRRGGHVC